MIIQLYANPLNNILLFSAIIRRVGPFFEVFFFCHIRIFLKKISLSFLVSFFPVVSREAFHSSRVIHKAKRTKPFSVAK